MIASLAAEAMYLEAERDRLKAANAELAEALRLPAKPTPIGTKTET